MSDQYIGKLYRVAQTQSRYGYLCEDFHLNDVFLVISYVKVSDFYIEVNVIKDNQFVQINMFSAKNYFEEIK